MALADELGRAADQADHSDIPAQYRPHAEINGDEGTAATGLVDDGLIGSDDDLLRLANLDPREWVVTDATKHIWTKETSKGVRRSVFFGFRRHSERHTMLTEWLAGFLDRTLPYRKPTGESDPLVVVISDMQIGKGEGDGTPGTIKRLRSCLEQVVAYAADDEPSELLLADAGDSIENMFSHTSGPQVATNDLTLDEQVQTWQKLFTEAIISLQPYTPRMRVTGTISNHGEVRSAQGHIGDGDFGLSTLRAIRDAFAMLLTDGTPEFVIPDNGTIVHSVRVGGATVAFTHGHAAGSPDKFSQWVANQAATALSPVARSNIVVRGHWHSPRVEFSRGRWILGAPTLDPGSRWWRDKTGEWSKPGMMTFRIHDGDLSDLRFWEP